jgi:hypothetical protein
MADNEHYNPPQLGVGHGVGTGPAAGVGRSQGCILGGGGSVPGLRMRMGRRLKREEEYGQ